MTLNGSRRALLGAALFAAVTAPAKAQAPITIGSPLALTGPYAFVGVAMSKGINLGIEELNRNNGINGTRINLIMEDSASDKAQTVTLVSRMIARDQVLAILGPATTIEVSAVGPLVNEKQVPLLTNSPSAEVRKYGKWSFNVTAAPADIMVKLANYGLDKMQVKRVAFVAARENESFQTQKNVVRDYWKSHGVVIVSDDALAAGETDFTALASKLTDSDIDALCVFIPPEQAANLVLQARQAGMPEKVRLIAPPGVVSESYLKIGGPAVAGTILVADYFPGSMTEINKAFIAAYRAKYGDVPDNWAAVGYTAVQILRKAIEEGGPDRAKLRDAMEHIKDMPTVLGNGSFTIGPERAPSYGAAILTVRDGKFVLAD